MPLHEDPLFSGDPSSRQLPNLWSGAGVPNPFGIAPVPLVGISAGLLPGGGRDDAGADLMWIRAAGDARQPPGLFTKLTERQLGAGNIRTGPPRNSPGLSGLSGLAGAVPGSGAQGGSRENPGTGMGALGRYSGPPGMGDAVADAMAFQAASQQFYSPGLVVGTQDDAAALNASVLSTFMSQSQSPYASSDPGPLSFGGGAGSSFGGTMADNAPGEAASAPGPLSFGGGAGSSFGGTMADNMPAAPIPPVSAPIPTTAARTGGFTAPDGTVVAIYADNTWQATGPSGTSSLRYASSQEDAYAQARRQVGGAPAPVGSNASVTQGVVQQPGWNWTADHRDAQGVWVDSAGVRADGSLGSTAPAAWTAHHKDALGRWVDASGKTYFGEQEAVASSPPRSSAIPGMPVQGAPPSSGPSAAQVIGAVGQSAGFLMGAGAAIAGQVPGGQRVAGMIPGQKPAARPAQSPGLGLGGMGTVAKVGLGLGALVGAKLTWDALSSRSAPATTSVAPAVPARVTA